MTQTQYQKTKPLQLEYRQWVQQTCKAALPQGSVSSNGWRTSLRLLSHYQSQRCHLELILPEAWGKAHVVHIMQLRNRYLWHWMNLQCTRLSTSTIKKIKLRWAAHSVSNSSECWKKKNNLSTCFKGAHSSLRSLMGLTVLSWGCVALHWCRPAIRECPAVAPPPAWGRSSTSQCLPIGLDLTKHTWTSHSFPCICVCVYMTSLESASVRTEDYKFETDLNYG